MRLRIALWLLLGAATAVSAGEGGTALEHRVWLRDGGPDAADLAALREAGVDGLVVDVGSAQVSKGTTTFTASPHVELGGLGGIPVSLAVTIGGEGDARGDAAAFWSQLSPSARGLAATGTIVLAAPRFWSGLPGFGAALAKESGHRVELMAAAVDLARAVPPGGWPDIGLVAVAFGEADALGFAGQLLDDDLSAVDRLDDLGVAYRVAVVVMPRVSPRPRSPHVNLRPLALSRNATYGLGEADRFTLRRSVDWGGTSVPSGATIELRLVNTGRYARDLGLLLRPVHPGLRGWDTVALPPKEPAAGMSLEAFLDFLRGNLPYPTPDIGARWLEPTRLELSVSNGTPHASGIGPTGNWVELRFRGTEVLDVQLGDFASMEWGAGVGEGFRRVQAPRGADAVRFHYLFLPPHDFIGGAVVTFVSRPSVVRLRWGVLPGDGTAVVGDWESAATAGR